MNDAGPPRLRHEPAFAKSLSGLAQKELAPERLARNQQQLARRLGQLAQGAAPTAAAGATGVLVKTGVVALLVGAALAGYLYFHESPSPLSSPPLTEPSAPQTPSSPTSMPGRHVASSPVPESPAASPAPQTADAPSSRPSLGSVSVSSARRQAGGGRDSRAPDPAAPAAPAAPAEPTALAAPVAAVVDDDATDLAEQLRLFTAARAAAQAGDYGQALAQLDELERRYPDTALRAELDLSRADYLARSGQERAAVTLLERLVADPEHVGRKAELLHTLGDLWRRQGDCTLATAAYREASQLGLAANQRAEVDRGLAACASVKMK